MVGIAGPSLENTGCSEGTVSSLTDHVRLNNEVLAGSSLERYLRMLISQGQLAQERELCRSKLAKCRSSDLPDLHCLEWWMRSSYCEPQLPRNQALNELVHGRV